MLAPGRSSILPSASLKVGCRPSASAWMPLSRNCSSVMAAAAATRLRALTWLVPVKITPFWFTTSTVPSALIAPWISLGFADAPTTRFSAASDAFCLNCSVVFRPTLKLSQFRMARDCVCSMVTTCRPSATLFAAPWRLPIGLRALGCPQAARRQPIRHAGAVGRCRRARGLRSLLRGHGRRRAVQVVERALQLLARLRLLLAGVADARQAAVRQAARALHGRLRRALVGEPAGAEGPRLRLRRARRAAGDQQRGHRLRQGRRPPRRRLAVPPRVTGDGAWERLDMTASFMESDLASAAPGSVAGLRMGA